MRGARVEVLAPSRRGRGIELGEESFLLVLWVGISQDDVWEADDYVIMVAIFGVTGH